MKNPKIKTNIITGLIGLGIGTIVFVLFFFLREISLKNAIDSSTLSTVILFALGGLTVLGYFGAFDTFAFGFKQLGTMMFNRKTPKTDTYIDYRDRRIEARKKSNLYFIGILISGCVFLLATIILNVILNISIS